MSDKVCAVPECGKRAICKGFCDKHYRRNKLYGDPLAVSRPPRECSVDGCDLRARAKGMCTMHYQRAKRLGDPGPAERLTSVNKGETCSGPECTNPAKRRGLCWAHETQIKRGQEELTPLRKRYVTKGQTAAERLEELSSPPDENGCRIWRGSVQKNGYPTMPRTPISPTKFAHRIAYMLSEGRAIPSYVPVHHTCGVSLCVEPSHLQAVRPEENSAEMLERRYYVERIEMLENALRELDEEHPVLAVSGVS